MFIDILIVIAGYWVALALAPILAWTLTGELRAAARWRVTDVRALLPRIETLLKYGEDGASLAVTPLGPEALRSPSISLTLNKYILPTGEYGLECFFPTSLGPRNFNPASSRYFGNSDWPRLAAFLSAQRIAMSEFESRPDTHWSDRYHLLRLEFGRDCRRAVEFAAFFFAGMLEMRPSPFKWRLSSINVLRRLLGKPVAALSKEQIADIARNEKLRLEPWLRKGGKPRAELKDLYLMLVQGLGISGLGYGLAFATPEWPALRFDLRGADIVLCAFDLVFVAIFILGALGNVILRRAKCVRLPLVAYLLVALMNAMHTTMRLAFRFLILAKVGGLKRFFAGENMGFGPLLSVSLPSKGFMGRAAAMITMIGVLACCAAMYRWQL